jgi:coproporphyrinogen III oxidase-like Fe-S oxidoreductase
MPANPPKTNLGLYVHWPFCQHKCPYCDFNSHVSTTHDNAAFGAALCQEMTHMAALLPDRRALTSLFFGGGTPSLPQQLKSPPKPIQHPSKRR